MPDLQHPRASAVQAQSQLIVIREDSRFLFGLQWTPLVGGRPSQIGRERARVLNASHYLIRGEPGAVLGYASISAAKKQRIYPLYSAAMHYVCTQPTGTVACVLPHREFGFWVVAAHEGTVLVQSDKWFASLEQAQELLNALTARFPQLTVCWLPTFEATTPPDWLCVRPDSQSRLSTLERPATFKLSFALGLLTLLIGLVYYSSKDSVNDSFESGPSASALWGEAMQRVASTYPLHTAVHIARVVEYWRQAPLRVAGWKLKRIQCEPKGLEWRCLARYQREHRLALNKGLEANTPVGWSFLPFDLDHALLTWTVHDAASLFDLTLVHEREDWMSYLQQITPIFEIVQVGVATRLAIAAPLSGQGAPLERPSAIPVWQKRSLSLKGPLRSVAALSGLRVPLHWKNLSLSVDVRSGHGIARSQLVVQFEGDLFETSH